MGQSKKHKLSKNCWCNPVVIDTTLVKVNQCACEISGKYNTMCLLHVLERIKKNGEI